MRLGDLDALKTKIEINFSRKPEAQAIYKHLIDIIEDAPTVCGNNSKWCESCVSKGKCASTRPQGKWARHDEWRNSEYIGGFYHINCPEIENGAAIFSKWESNFCPNCGADMRGEEK